MIAIAERLHLRLHGRAPWTVVILAVVVVALIVADVILLLAWQSQQAVSNARTAAVAAANEKVPTLLSYSYSTFGTALTRAESNVTDQFWGTYGHLMTSQIEPAAKKDQVVAQASVTGTSVVSAQPGTVTLLMILDQQTKTNTRTESVLNNTAVRVVMQKVNGTWLVDDLLPRS